MSVPFCDVICTKLIISSNKSQPFYDTMDIRLHHKGQVINYGEGATQRQRGGGETKFWPCNTLMGEHKMFWGSFKD